MGIFNIFNSAHVTPRFPGDIDLQLETRCNVRVDRVPNGFGLINGVCDPTQGLSFTPQTIENFGKINVLRGRRVIEVAVKYYF